MEQTVIDKCMEWIKYWGSGGGCYSLETHIKDSLEGFDGNKDDVEAIRIYLKNNTSPFGCNEEVFFPVIEAMLGEVKT